MRRQKSGVDAKEDGMVWDLPNRLYDMVLVPGHAPWEKSLFGLLVVVVLVLGRGEIRWAVRDGR